MKKYIKLMSKHEFKSLFPYRASECVPVKIIGQLCHYNADECLMTLTWKEGNFSVEHTGHISPRDFRLLKDNLECEYLFYAAASDGVMYLILIPNKQEYELKKEERAKHYVVTKGEYSDYHIVTVCSDRSVAEKIAERINREAGYETCGIEEYEDGEVVFDETLTAYFVDFNKGTVKKDLTGGRLTTETTAWKTVDGTIYGMFVFAKDEEQAMKIASDKRAMLMAQKAGL